ncbi:MAG: ATP-binding protein [bacterium]|nr:ATP-binding protein [bacterium]
MQTKYILLLLSAIINAIFSIFVLIRNPRLIVNRLFSLFALLVSAWVFSNFLIESAQSEASALLWLRMALAIASMIPVSCLIFVKVFPLGRKLEITGDIKVFFILGCIFCGISFTPAIMAGAHIYSWGVQDRPGPLLPLYTVYFTVCFVWALVKLYSKHKAARGVERLQIQYLTLGIAVSLLITTCTNLLLPLIFQSSYFAGYGPSFSIIMLAFIAHTIVRYRLLQIHLVIKKSFIYFFSIILAVTSFVFLLIYGEKVMRGVLGLSSLTIMSLAALVVVIGFQPLRVWLQSIFDRYFYREAYNYNSTLLEISRSLTSMLRLEELTDYIYNVIYSTMHPEKVYLYLKDSRGSAFRIALARSPMDEAGNARETISGDSQIAAYLASKREIMLREELIRLSSERGIEGVITEMAKLGVDVAVPIILDGYLTAVMVLGPKLSGDIYSIEDMGLLMAMANQAAAAINNAQLYEEVRRVRDYNESILANMESGVITVDKQGMAVLFNRAATRILALETDDLTGHHIYEINSILAEKVDDVLERGVTCSNLEIALPQNEESLPLMISSTILKGIREDIEGVILVFSDLSRIKALEEERNQAERLACIGGLAAGLAHEIKNPLVSIKTFAQLLPDKFDDLEFREAFSKLVVKEIERIDLLVSQLLGFARSTQVEMMPINIKDPLDEMLLLLSNRLQERQIEIKKYYPPGGILVFADGGKMKQLFLNLFINGIEAMPDGGSLSIDIASYDKDGNKWFRIMIANTGSKISPKLKQKVFTPFYSTKPGGTGLGLSICQKIINEHGGVIFLSDEEVTRFNIDLPAFKIPSIGIEA